MKPPEGWTFTELADGGWRLDGPKPQCLLIRSPDSDGEVEIEEESCGDLVYVHADVLRFLVSKL